ncbi:hypothetical protein DFI_18235 (plasmid) [Deinococcus ficus]|uniref:Immunity MXAN-0049 protein domain-containing protein n=1 Tax=Deinococcus ficus TaxID=317577 RepID=A0A221T2Q9_9DEIO|nr:hypothetical protein DFI_18235 [Deinococcus ficus]
MVPDIVRAALPALAFSRAAAEHLRNYLLQHGELLPLTLDGEEEAYFIYHAVRHPRVMDPAREGDAGFHFRRDRIGGHHFFQLRRYTTFFVSDQFTEAYSTANLTGLKFREVWPEAQKGPNR